jgi:hypothetical protein
MENIIYFLYILKSLLKIKVEGSRSLSFKIENGFKCSRSPWLDQSGAGEKG